MTFAAAPNADNEQTLAAWTTACGGVAESVPSRAEFFACVDRCVMAVMRNPLAARPAEPAQAQLRAWLKDETPLLGDDTPIDMALFDAALLSIEERIAPQGPAAQAQLVHACRLLAETIYAGGEGIARR